MKTRLVTISLIGVIAVTAVAVTGCCICCNWHGQEHYERTEQLSAAMAGIEQISVDSSFGEIKITGADTADCNVVAKITGNAPTKEEAKQLAEQTRIKLETDGKTLIVRAEKPALKKNRCIGVGYDILIPVKTSVKCKTSFGAVKLANLLGDVVAHTSFGEIDAEKISGSMQLNTSYGEVDCDKITTGDFTAKSSFGKVEVAFTDACPADLKAKIQTSFGEIKADIPPVFAGSIAVETSFGKVKTDLPITIKGDLGKDRVTGSIGQGDGNLDLKTSFGNVTIK